MKIISLQLSNILSFKHIPTIDDVPKIPFDDNLNIIIGENGSGKSTALEVINFLFKRVIYKQYNFNQDIFTRRAIVSVQDRKQIITPTNNNSFEGFRLDPNWNTPTSPQTIRLVVVLDEIDKANITLLRDNATSLNDIFGRYSTRGIPSTAGITEKYTIDVKLDRINRTFSVSLAGTPTDFGYEYLSEYNSYKEAISLYNFENTGSSIPSLHESFTIISSYRNYNAFNTAVALNQSSAIQQIQQIRSADFGRSLNATDNSEPPIFALVRLQVADKHFNFLSEKMSPEERETAANDLPFMKSINARLAIVKLSCRIKLTDQRTWQYSFQFFDLRRGVPLPDINSLSAGQKSIIHLIFEAYGRGDLKGGVVVIDEPEIHLHYQFQHEYLQVVRELNKQQQCQYIIVTHSEALVSTSTISNVRRFSLSPDGTTEFHSPVLAHEQKLLVRILDYTRSTYAFFAKKVVLVEGDSDRYFFRAVLQALYPDLDQQIAIIHVGGKGSFPQWTTFFEAFGLTVYRIADLDYCQQLFYSDEAKTSLKTATAVAAYKASHPDLLQKISDIAQGRTFILSDGDLEKYLQIQKDLSNVIQFCEARLESYLANTTDLQATEVKDIIRRIVQ